MHCEDCAMKRGLSCVKRARVFVAVDGGYICAESTDAFDLQQGHSGPI